MKALVVLKRVSVVIRSRVGICINHLAHISETSFGRPSQLLTSLVVENGIGEGTRG